MDGPAGGSSGQQTCRAADWTDAASEFGSSLTLTGQSPLHSRNGPMPQPSPLPGTSPRPPAAPIVYVVRRRTVAAAGLAGLTLALWASAASWALVFRDETLARITARERSLHYAYEERVSALRARLDRVATQKLLEQDGVETRIAELASRQVALENRQAMLAGLAEQAGETPDAPPVTGALPARGVPQKPVPVPLPNPEALGLRTEGAPVPVPLGPVSRVAGLETALAGIAAQQSLTLDRILQRSQVEASRLRRVMAEVGLDPGRFAPARGGLGGPLVPVGSGPFETAVTLAQRSLGERDQLRRILKGLPLQRPLAFDGGLSSHYGYRVDPFTRGLALHTGIDLRAESGAPAQAAGAGTVTAAEYSGGYGNMVEIDHGHGIVTRYAHLSAIGVAPGQSVAAGQVVGRVGSTGRSTAPHLHYETRIDGEPVDPQRFLRASARLFAAR